MWPLWLAQALYHLGLFETYPIACVRPLWLAWAFYLLHAHYPPPLSPHSLTYPQPFTHSLPYPQPSPCAIRRMSEFMTHKHSPSTAPASSQPPEKRRRTETPPHKNITKTERALRSLTPTSSGRGRPRRRGMRSPEKQVSKLLKYVDSGGPHQASMVIDDLTSKHHLSNRLFQLPNILRKKSTTPPITPMSASASSAVAS